MELGRRHWQSIIDQRSRKWKVSVAIFLTANDIVTSIWQKLGVLFFSFPGNISCDMLLTLLLLCGKTFQFTYCHLHRLSGSSVVPLSLQMPFDFFCFEGVGSQLLFLT
jgi:hypothetical protein